MATFNCACVTEDLQRILESYWYMGEQISSFVIFLCSLLMKIRNLELPRSKFQEQCRIFVCFSIASTKTRIGISLVNGVGRGRRFTSEKKQEYANAGAEDAVLPSSWPSEYTTNAGHDAPYNVPRREGPATAIHFSVRVDNITAITWNDSSIEYCLTLIVHAKYFRKNPSIFLLITRHF